MKRCTLKALCAALGLGLASATVVAGDTHIRGKHLDDASTYLHGRAPNTEDVNAPGGTAPPFRISIDGMPVDGPVTDAHFDSLPDAQRRSDVALGQADIRIKFDPLQVKPALNA